MNFWICDTRAEARWSDWLDQKPPKWESLLIVEANIPAKGSPELLLIHDGNGWTEEIPYRFPKALTIRYSETPLDLEMYEDSTPPQPFCSLDHLQSHLLPILINWNSTTPDVSWIWAMLGGRDVLETALELLYALLPPALDASLSPDPQNEAWNKLVTYVSKLKSSGVVEEKFAEVRTVYENCIDPEGVYIENLSKLRNRLLGNDAYPGLVAAIEQARRNIAEIPK